MQTQEQAEESDEPTGPAYPEERWKRELDGERPNPKVKWECGYLVGTEEWCAYMLQGVQDKDLNAPRMPEWMVRDFMREWGMCRRETIWRSYLPHIPYTEKLTIKEASGLFPYNEHKREADRRKAWNEGLERDKRVAKEGERTGGYDLQADGKAESGAEAAEAAEATADPPCPPCPTNWLQFLHADSGKPMGQEKECSE